MSSGRTCTPCPAGLFAGYREGKQGHCLRRRRQCQRALVGLGGEKKVKLTYFGVGNGKREMHFPTSRLGIRYSDLTGRWNQVAKSTPFFFLFLRVFRSLDVENWRKSDMRREIIAKTVIPGDFASIFCGVHRPLLPRKQCSGFPV